MSVSKPYILKLPDEIFIKIFTLIVALPHEVLEPEAAFDLFRETFPNYRYDHKLVANLTLTCKRFYHNAAPFNYFAIELAPGWPAPAPFLQRLRRLKDLLNTNPGLGQHLRNLKISIYHLTQAGVTIPEEIFTLMEDLLPFFKNLLHLTLVSLDINPGLTGRLLRQAAKHQIPLEEVEVLDIQDYFTNLASVSRDLDIPILKVFRLQCPPAQLVAPGNLPQAYPPPQLSQLRLGSGRAGPSVLKDLIQWPNNLSSFHFDYWIDRNREPITLPMIQSMISVHAPTLTKLTLFGPFRDSRETSLDLSEFTALDTLMVARRLLGNLSEEEYADVGKLLAPKLRKFVIDIRPTSRGFNPSTELGFGQTEEDWVRWFAQDALDRSIRLEEIRITHSSTFEIEPWLYFFAFQRTYPWDHIETLERELAPKGISVTFNRLTITKFSFEERPKFPPADYMRRLALSR